ncbi:MAG: serine/threonine-protein phosphatase [Actinobacteria bacterium]|nr:serine/threonine-protein phosphatase [Actinomycetota bacterium]
MGAVIAADVLTGPELVFMPLLSLGPAFAAVFHSVRNTALIGLLALALCAAAARAQRGINTREEVLAFATVAGISVAALIAGVARQRREAELADVQAIAEVAQQVVLRKVPPRAGATAFAARYLSAAARAHIGGDLYEVVPGLDGTRLIIGDAQGKGLAAVQRAASVLGAFREAAQDAAGLEAIADRIETSLARQPDDEEFVTAVLAQVSPDGSKVSLLNRGHPAPLLLSPGRQPRPAEPSSPGLPLRLSGLADTVPDVTTVELDAGESMLFYTDGMSEARDRAGEFFPLAEQCVQLDLRDPEAALDELRARLLRHAGHPLADDAAMLLVTRLSSDGHPAPAPPPSGLSSEPDLPTRSPGIARRPASWRLRKRAS